MKLERRTGAQPHYGRHILEFQFDAIAGVVASVDLASTDSLVDLADRLLDEP